MDSAVPPAGHLTFAAARDQDLRPLARRTTLGPYRLRSGNTVRFNALHLDTPDLTLTRSGVALRLQQQGRSWEAVLDRLGHSNGAGTQDGIVRTPLPRRPRLPFSLPDGPLRIHLRALVAERPLNAILRVEVNQRGIDVLPPGTDDTAPPIARLTLDRIRVFAPDERQPYARYLSATVRPGNGGGDDLAPVAELLHQECGLTPRTESALTSALKARFGTAVVAVNTPVILAHDTVETAARKIVCRHLSRLRQHDPGTRIGDDPEALHDLRVAVRRLRAAVRAFAPAFPVRLHKQFTEELQWLGQISSGVRDLDVQLARLHQHSTALPLGHRAGLVSLRDYLQAERTRLRSELLSGMESQRYFDLLIRLEGYAYGPARTRPRDPAAREQIGTVGAQGLQGALRRLLKRGADVRGAPTPEDLHALRIRAKRLRYLLEFLQELIGKRGRRLVKRLVELQDLLGTYHDAIVTAEFVRKYAEGPGAQQGAASLLTLGAVASSALRVAEDKCRDFERTWERFARKRTRKEFRLALERLVDLGKATPQGGGDASPTPPLPAPTEPTPPTVEPAAPPDTTEAVARRPTEQEKV